MNRWTSARQVGAWLSCCLLATVIACATTALEPRAASTGAGAAEPTAPSSPTTTAEVDLAQPTIQSEDELVDAFLLFPLMGDAETQMRWLSAAFDYLEIEGCSQLHSVDVSGQCRRLLRARVESSTHPDMPLAISSVVAHRDDDVDRLYRAAMGRDRVSVERAAVYYLNRSIPLYRGAAGVSDISLVLLWGLSLCSEEIPPGTPTEQLHQLIRTCRGEIPRHTARWDAVLANVDAIVATLFAQQVHRAVTTVEQGTSRIARILQRGSLRAALEGVEGYPVVLPVSLNSFGAAVLEADRETSGVFEIGSPARGYLVHVRRSDVLVGVVPTLTLGAELPAELPRLEPATPAHWRAVHSQTEQTFHRLIEEERAVDQPTPSWLSDAPAEQPVGPLAGCASRQDALPHASTLFVVDGDAGSESVLAAFRELARLGRTEVRWAFRHGAQSKEVTFVVESSEVECLGRLDALSLPDVLGAVTGVAGKALGTRVHIP